MELKDSICENSVHFFQTGFAKSMSRNKAGYCLLIQNDRSTDVKNDFGIVVAKSNAIKFINDTCEKFKYS